MVFLDDFLNYFLYKLSLNSKQIHQIVHKYTFYEVLVFLEGFLVVRHRLLCRGEDFGFHQTLLRGETLVCSLIEVDLLLLLLVLFELFVVKLTFEQGLLQMRGLGFIGEAESVMELRLLRLDARGL